MADRGQEIRRLKLLEEENRKLKRCGGLESRQVDAAGRARKKTLRPGRRRELVRIWSGPTG